MTFYDECSICDHVGSDVRYALVRLSERGSDDLTPFAFGPRCDDRRACDRRRSAPRTSLLADRIGLDPSRQADTDGSDR
jgi:hypothetical protein